MLPLSHLHRGAAEVLASLRVHENLDRLAGPHYGLGEAQGRATLRGHLAEPHVELPMLGEDGHRNGAGIVDGDRGVRHLLRGNHGPHVLHNETEATVRRDDHSDPGRWTKL